MQTQQPGGWPPPPPRRPLAPATVPALPAGVPSAPPLPPATRRRGPLLAAAVLCVVLAAVLGSVAIGQFRADHAPAAVVQRYFAALASGNAPAALSYASSAPRGEYLTSVVLGQQLAVARLSDVVVHASSTRGATATVQVSYRLGFRSGPVRVEDTAQLVKRHSSWRLSRVASSVNLDSDSAGANRLSFAGRPVPTGDVLLFPGALPVVSDSPAVQPDGRPLVQLSDDGQISRLSASVSIDAKRELTVALGKALTGCLAGSSRDPNCPLPDAGRPIPGSLRGSQTTADSDTISISLSSAADGTIDLSANVSVRGRWQAWDFNNQAISKSGNTDLDLHAVASIRNLNAVYWVKQ